MGLVFGHDSYSFKGYGDLQMAAFKQIETQKFIIKIRRYNKAGSRFTIIDKFPALDTNPIIAIMVSAQAVRDIIEGASV